MPPSELRKEAREILKGRWGKAVYILLAYLLVTFAIGFVEGLFEESGFIFLLIEIAALLISMPLSFGLIVSFVKFKRCENVSAFEFLKDGFSRFGKAWGIFWHTFIRMLLPIVCIVLVATLLSFSIGLGVGSGNYILAIIIVALYIATLVYTVSRSLLYTLAYIIGYDNPELSSKDCVLKSAELMKGNRGNYLLLILSFIGWAILSIFTLGIGMLWLIPYTTIAEICFYDRIVKEEAKIEE